MMDRNREARRAAAMSNGLQRRRHRPITDDDGPLDLQETARLRDRTVKRDRDRDVRHRVDRDRERERLNRSKRRRGVDDGGGGGGDDSSEESVNDEDEEDAGPPPAPPQPQPQPSMRYIPPSNPSPVSSSPPASTTALTHRKSYPPPTKMFRSTVAPTWKAPDEMIGFSIPRKARSASTKRSHDCWTSSSMGGDHILRQQSSSPVRSTTTATATANNSASPLAAPMSPSSSNISMKKKMKPSGGSKPKGVPKPCPKSSTLNQEEIEIEVAEVLYGLMRQSQGPSTSKLETMENDSTKTDRSYCDAKSSISPPPITTEAPKRKRPRPYPEENPKVEWDQVPKSEAKSPTSDKAATAVGSTVENGDLLSGTNPVGAVANGVDSEGTKKVGEESKVEEITSSIKLESQLHNRVESTSTSTSAKPSSTFGEKNHREEKLEIDLMAPPPAWRGSPEREGGGKRGDEKAMVTDREADEEENEKGGVKKRSSENVEVNVNRAEGECDVDVDDTTTKSKAVIPDDGPHKQQQEQQPQQPLHPLDLDKSDNHKPPSKADDEPTADTKPGGQSSSMPMPMSVPAGWHGGLAPMGYVAAPLQGVGLVSMDGTPMASPSVQAPNFIFSQPKPKRCATHCCIARSISVHQHMMKMHPFWPAAAAGSAPLFGAKPPYNLNMVPPADLQAAARAGVVVSSSQDKGQPSYAFFPGSKDKSPLTPNAPDSAQKKQFLLPQNLPPGAPTNVLPAPAFFFPFGQQQAAAAAAAAASSRPGTINPPSSGPSSASSTPTSSVAPAGVSSAAPGPAMTFSYPNMAGNETQFMAILGNSPYPFPIPGSTPYRGSQPQAMSFFNGSFYSSPMLHPSQLQQQQQPTTAAAQSLQIQQQNPSISTSSSTSQKHQQNQQQRLQGNAGSAAMAPNANLHNFQATKNRPSHPHHEVGSEDSPSTADSRTRPNLSVYGQNFAMPFHSSNFTLLTPSSSIGGGGSNAAAGVPNGNHSDKKQQQQQSQQPAFPMSFASVKGPTAPGLDIASMANNPAILQSLPEAVRHNYQIMAAAAQAAQAANHQRKNVAETTGGEEERRAMASRTSAAPVGQSIAFSRDSGDNSMATMPGNSVVDSSARSVNLGPGSNRPARSSAPNTLANNSSVSNPQQQQMLFPKQQQFVAATVAAARGKTPSTSNGGAYPDHFTSKFPNNVPNFPLVQSSGAPSQSSQWKNSVRPNTSPPVATSSAAPTTIKNLPQQGRPQQNHTQISFASAAQNPKPSPTSQGQQVSNSNQLPSSPMMVGSPTSSSVSKSAGGSARTVTSSSTANKSVPQTSTTLSTQQGKNSPSTSLSSQKPFILGSSHMISSSNSTSKPQSQEPQQQPQLSKQSIQQAQLFFSNAYMQASGNTSAGGGYYLQRHRPENQQQQQTSKSQGSGPPTSSSGMLSLCTPVSLANTITSDPAKPVAANSMKGNLPPQGIFHAAQFAAAQPAGGAPQLVSTGFPYVHAASTAVQIKPAEQKQPAGE